MNTLTKVRSALQPRLISLFNDGADTLYARVIAIYGILVAFNLGAWLWAGITFHHYPVLLGTALLAYGFGLRHAVDADHIAAIDNVTRKLMQEIMFCRGWLFLFARPFHCCRARVCPRSLLRRPPCRRDLITTGKSAAHRRNAGVCAVPVRHCSHEHDHLARDLSCMASRQERREIRRG